MFKKARLKLTAWYLLIIMTISISFSAFIYKSFTTELHGRLSAIDRRLGLQRLGFTPPPGEVELFISDINEARERVLYTLVYTNALILVLSAGAGYFLAGKTLKPIEETMEEQKRFVSDASHELKTPLTSLQTAIEVALRDKKLDVSEARSVLNENLEDVENLKNLSSNLLSLSRYQQDHNFFTIEKVNVKSVVSAALRIITPLAKSKKIKLTTSIEKQEILSNSEALEKLVTILLDNAVKYTPQNGKVSLVVKKENKNLTISVKDSGVGISKQDLPHIFDRFYRVDKSRSKVEVPGKESQI
jgi:two-component system sensor histidine kinase CiaH